MSSGLWIQKLTRETDRDLKGNVNELYLYYFYLSDGERESMDVFIAYLRKHNLTDGKRVKIPAIGSCGFEVLRCKRNQVPKPNLNCVACKHLYNSLDRYQGEPTSFYEYFGPVFGQTTLSWKRLVELARLNGEDERNVRTD